MFTSTPTPSGHIVMSQWNIVVLKFENGEVLEKFLGLDDATGRYRISSEVLVYDDEIRSGRTRSGSHYRFIDKPGKLHPDARQVLDYLDSQINITASLKFPQHLDV
jgi:hypothetical protein